jgi:hypothetical protein
MTSPSSGSGGASGSADAEGSGTTGPTTDGTTHEVQPGTTTGDATSGPTSSTSTGDELGITSTGASASCDEIFGAAPGYLLCTEDPSSCAFNVTLGGADCNSICAMFGTTCLAAFDNPVQTCEVQGNSFCANNAKNDTICVCSK